MVSASAVGDVIGHLLTTATPGERDDIVNETPANSSSISSTGERIAADYISATHIRRHLLVCIAVTHVWFTYYIVSEKSRPLDIVQYNMSKLN